MSNFGGPNSAFEKDINTRLKKLNRQFTLSTKKISSTMEGVLTNPLNNTAYWRKVQKVLDDEYAKMSKAYQEWAKVQIPAGYKGALRDIDKKVAARYIKYGEAKKSVTSILNSRATTVNARILWTDSYNSFLSALTNGKRNMERLTRMTQQALVSEAFLEGSVAQAIELGNLKNAIKTIGGELYKELAKAVDNNGFVQAGSRKFRPQYYAEMVARVKFHEAQAIAAVQTAKNYGTDLVLVSSHNTTTEICQQYEGKIFSISGNDPRFPFLDLMTPFHVNCLHLLFPQFEEALQASNQLEQYSDFSKGKTDRPPGPASFIPVSERSAS